MRGLFFARRKAMPITTQQLLQILPNAGAKAGVFVPVLCSSPSILPEI